MTTIEVPFSMTARVGDVVIEDVVSGAISVNLCDDPKDDEINAWRKGKQDGPLGLPYASSSKIERAAIAEARSMHKADLDAATIAAQSNL